MLKITCMLLTIGFCGAALAAAPVIDNERLTAWDTSVPLGPAQHDYVAVSLTRLGHAEIGRKGSTPKVDGRTIVVELKDVTLPAIANSSGYPLAFPRPRVLKLLENDRVIVWDYQWRPGEPTPMHFHDKDALVVYEADGALESTTPDGKKTLNDNKFADVKFNKRDRVHTELLISGTGHAVITELK